MSILRYALHQHHLLTANEHLQHNIHTTALNLLTRTEIAAVQRTHVTQRSGCSNGCNFDAATITSADAANASRCRCLLHSCKYRHIIKSVLWLYQYAGPRACFAFTHIYRYPTLIMYTAHSTMLHVRLQAKADRSNTRRINVTMTLHETLFSHTSPSLVCVWWGDFRNCLLHTSTGLRAASLFPSPKIPSLSLPSYAYVLPCSTNARTQRNNAAYVTPSPTTRRLPKFEVKSTNVSALHVIVRYVLDDYVHG
jgi:hypothetical protein